MIFGVPLETTETKITTTEYSNNSNNRNKITNTQ